MRLAALTLAVLGLLGLSATFAVAQERSANVPAAPYVAVATDEAVVTPVQRYAYRPVPGWYGYNSYPRYYTYRPRYGYAVPRYYGYYADPYPGYYYPNGFGFEYHGPRRTFSFGF